MDKETKVENLMGVSIDKIALKPIDLLIEHHKGK